MKVISNIVSHIVNVSLSSGVFPSKLKKDQQYPDYRHLANCYYLVNAVRRSNYSVK